MKIKYFIIPFLFFCTSFMGFTQNNSSVYYDAIVSDGLMRIEHNNPNGNNIDLSKVKGSPYESSTFKSGKAIDRNTGNIEHFFIRYNIYNDIIELKPNLNDKSSNGLVKSDNFYIILNNKEYHYKKYAENNTTKKGYFILLKKGNNSSLYLKKIKKFKDKVIPKDSFEKEKPASFTDDKAYYLQKGDLLVKVSGRKKKFIEQYPEISKELSKYIKSEKINLKNEKDLIKLFNYLDTLLK